MTKGDEIFKETVRVFEENRKSMWMQADLLMMSRLPIAMMITLTLLMVMITTRCS